MDNRLNRCFGSGSKIYENYHDNEWGFPLHNDQKLFEMLSLEGAQAGLSWEIILKKREGYRKAFHNFDPQIIASMQDEELELLLYNSAIVRNRLKIYSVRNNARIFLDIQKEYGSFSSYIWNYTENRPIQNKWQNGKEVPSKTPLSDEISKDLKKRGMKFVGSTIIYAFMQAIGIVNDHTRECFKYPY